MTIREAPSVVPIAYRAERAAAPLDVGTSTFLKWVEEGKMPKPVKVSERVLLWDVKALACLAGNE
jgi:hypothetical protein